MAVGGVSGRLSVIWVVLWHDAVGGVLLQC